MQSDYDRVRENFAPATDTATPMQAGKLAVLAWLSSHQKTVLISVFCLFLTCYFLELTGSFRHLSMRSLGGLSLLCSLLLALGYANFGKTLPRLKPKSRFLTQAMSQPIPTYRTDFTTQPWSGLHDCGLAGLEQRFAGRLAIDLPDDRLVWINMRVFYDILEVLIERILAKPGASLRLRCESGYQNSPYQSLALDILGAEEAEYHIETLFVPTKSSLPNEQHFMFARHFMQQAGGKLLYKSDLRKAFNIIFLFPKVE